MSLIPVNSSSIRAVGYDPFTSTLGVLFHTSDTIYTHPNVPFSVYLSLILAESKGTFYNQQIRGKYR